MAKTKNKKNSGVSDKIQIKKAQDKTKKKLNPFEVHINREKFKVIGKKSKTDRGLPGVSRAKAIQKRKNTIGYEMKIMNKTNTFLDKRIGEKNNKLTDEEKIMARFAAERIQQHKTKAAKQSIYNLADDELLTHRGHTLEEIEKYDDPRSDDEEDEAFNKQFGNLGNDFVSDANFGGGVLSRNDHKDGALSRKDVIEQLIIDSKKRKLEKQKLKEETLDLTEKLDSEWKDLHTSIISQHGNSEANSKEEPSLIDKLLIAHDKKNENYDKTMRELKFCPRGTPSDRLKSEDEVAKIEKEKLEKLEADRIARMKGEVETGNIKSTHRSADALDEGYEIDSDPEITIMYDADGQLLTKLPQDKSDKNEEESADEEDESDQEDEEEEESDADSLNDLRESESDASDEENQVESDKGKRKLANTESKSKKKIKHENSQEDINDKITEKNLKAADDFASKIKEELMTRKIMMEKAAAELPFTYEMPQSYEELHDLLSKQSSHHQAVIIERIIKCNHPKLGEENKEKLASLFTYLLQYINDLFLEDLSCNSLDICKAFDCYEKICPYFYDISIMNPAHAGYSILEVIKEKFEDYRKSPKKFPCMDTIIFFKLVSFLFPTSDFKHPIVTPCFIMMSEILTNAKITSTIDISKGLFLTALILEYTTLSKRYVPAALNFIRNVLFMCVSPVKKMRIKPLPPLKHPSSFSNLLVVSSEIKEKINSLPRMRAEDLYLEQNNDMFKMSCLVTAVKMFQEFVLRANDNKAQEPMFEVHMQLLDRVTLSNYPETVSSFVNELKSNLENKLDSLTLKPLQEPKKPKMLKLFEPSVENNFTGKKQKNISKEKAEHEKLLYKYRKEMKGALREIRRDKTFISAVKIKDKIQRDDLRKQKVKQIYSEASEQQGELKALKRLKKKK